MNPLSSGLIVPAEHYSQIQADVSSRSFEEACGFLAGLGNRTRLVIPVSNILHDRYRFRMDPKEELNAFQQVEEAGLEILAIYHSHPQGIQQPSPTDRAELTFPGIIYLIFYQEGQDWRCRGYLMESEGEAREVPVIISENT